MARERYLVHAGEETIHSDRFARKPQTPKEKRQNFWYYHKWHVLIGAFVAILLAFIVYDTVSKVEPDYTVGLVTEYQMTEGQLQKLESNLQLAAKDRNGDGKVKVTVSNYVVGNEQTDPQVVSANVTRLMGDITSFDVNAFLCDKRGHAYLLEQGGWDKTHEQLPCPALLQVKGWDLTLNMRRLDAAADKKYDAHKAAWDEALQLVQAMDDPAIRQKAEARDKAASTAQNAASQAGAGSGPAAASGAA